MNCSPSSRQNTAVLIFAATTRASAAFSTDWRTGWLAHGDLAGLGYCRRCTRARRRRIRINPTNRGTRLAQQQKHHPRKKGSWLAKWKPILLFISFPLRHTNDASQDLLAMASKGLSLIKIIASRGLIIRVSHRGRKCALTC